MIDILGTRQQQLLQLLLKNKGGVTIDYLVKQLTITRTAVRQHLAALENEGLVEPSVSRPSGGRPEQLYVLSEKGHELFPRQYSWLAELVIDSIRQESGDDQLRQRLNTIGTRVGESWRNQNPGLIYPTQTLGKLSELMEQLGYDVSQVDAQIDGPVIEAHNCIFHNLAFKDPSICEFDLALLSTFTGKEVDHQECMAKGGNVCRFKFEPKS